MNVFLTNLVLGLVWCAITGSFHPANILFGVVLAYLALWIPRHRFGQSRFMDRSRRVLALLWLFVVELVKSAWSVAKMTLAPGNKFTPGIVAVPLSCDRDIEIMLLANMITLTPGTLSLDVSDDRSTLYVHAMDVADEAALIMDIKNGFERRIMDVFDDDLGEVEREPSRRRA